MSRRIIIWLTLMLVLPAELLVSGGPPDSSEEVELTPRSMPAERELISGEQHVYPLMLKSNEYLYLLVEQKGVDVVVSLTGPDGQPLLKVDSPVGMQDPESIYLVAPVSGRYRLTVRSPTATPRGHYQVRIVAWRDARPPDHDRAAAAKAMATADDLRLHHRELRAALEGYQKAAQHWKAAGETARQAFALYWAGLMQDKLGETQLSIDSLKRSLERFRESGDDSKDVASVLYNLGRHYRTLGELETSLDFLEEALRLARKLRDPRREVSYLSNIALTYKALGRPQQALTFYEQALALWQELGGGLAGEAQIRSNLGALYTFLGQPERARGLLEEALQLSRESGDRRAEASALRPLGALQRRLGKLDESLSSIQQLLSLQQKSRDLRGEAVALTELMRTYFDLEQYEAAFEAGEQALAVFRDTLNRKGEGEVLCNLGWFHNKLKDPERALIYLTQALKAFKLAQSRSGEASALYVVALAERQRGDFLTARDRIEEALDSVESLRSQIGRDADFLERLKAGDDEILTLRSSFLADKQDYYELNIDILIDLHENDPTAGYDARALKASERRRARSLLDILTKVVESPDRGSDTTAPTPLVGAPPLGLEEIRQLLDEDTLFLEYTLGKARSFLWLVTPTELWYHQLPGRSEIEQLAQDVHRLLSQVRGRQGRGQLTQWSTDLSEVLLGPVAGRLGAKRLLVVGDEALQYIPFAALPLPPAHPATSSHAPGAPMVTVHEIVQLPSASVLAMLRQQTEARALAPKLIAVVADPVFDARDSRVKKAATGDPPTSPDPTHSFPLERLPASGAEAEAILALALALAAVGESLAALGFDANLEMVRRGTLAGYRYVHFAIHGLFDPRRPELLGLMLSQVDEHGRWRDGFLRPHEIYRLDLPVEMVVLSACRSGLGREVRGEGLVGLTQSFLYAGAARVMASLWRVDDQATAELMERFYRGIFEDGLRPAAALRSAQLSMLGERRWAAPYYWAGFFLQGEWR